MTNRAVTRSELEHAAMRLGDHPECTDKAVVMALYAAEMMGQAFRKAASMIPDSVQGVRGENNVSLRYLSDHLFKEAQRIERGEPWPR